ncbi:Glutathione S-transferase T1-like protein [Drosera capensis]
MASLKIYVDRNSQPSRAILLFCKINGIEFEEVTISLFKREHRTPEFEAINPMKQLPALVHGDFKLFESHAILIYLATAFPGVADHWYPADPQKRAKVQSALDWHHSNLRRGSVGFIFNTLLAPLFGVPPNPAAAAEGEKTLIASLLTIETFWLQGEGKFLCGNDQPSIADLALSSEVFQLQMMKDVDYNRIVSPFKKVLQWVEHVKNATQPHFDDVYAVVIGTIAEFKKHP